MVSPLVKGRPEGEESIRKRMGSSLKEDGESIGKE
jgi:hypothetical protein